MISTVNIVPMGRIGSRGLGDSLRATDRAEGPRCASPPSARSPIHAAFLQTVSRPQDSALTSETGRGGARSCVILLTGLCFGCLTEQNREAVLSPWQCDLRIKHKLRRPQLCKFSHATARSNFRPLRQVGMGLKLRANLIISFSTETSNKATGWHPFDLAWKMALDTSKRSFLRG